LFGASPGSLKAQARDLGFTDGDLGDIFTRIVALVVVSA
jgi:hypothetical protein